MNAIGDPLPCQHKGCEDIGMPCYLSYGDSEPDGWYCGEHAPEYGFCGGCGHFCAGTETFDFNAAGLCDNCIGELEEELEDGEWDEDDWGDDDDY